MRICLLSHDILGPIRNGGIGTAFTALATQLAADGHDVTLAFAADYTQTLPLAAWVDHYAARGIRLEPLYLVGSEAMQSWRAYRWLDARAFDVVHFHEWRGLGFFAAVARRCGLGLQRTALVCQLHSPTGWHRHHNGGFVRSEVEAEVSFMERRSAEWADLVYSPSAYMLDWVRKEGWELPAELACHPNLLPPDFEPGVASRSSRQVNELVFFGRLEERKGIELFCSAVRRLLRGDFRPGRVTFLGKVGDVAGGSALDWLMHATRSWDIPWQVRNDLDVLGARDYLAQTGRLAVIASVADNSPYTVLECIAAGTPFVAADVGGIAELVAPADRAEALFERNVEALAARLAGVLVNGARTIRPAMDFDDNIARWRDMQFRAAALAPRPARPAEQPLVSVCVTTFERPALLAEALSSLEAQTYPSLEVVVVDDASTDLAACAFLDAIAPRLAARGWTLIRHAENSYLGASRNTAVAAAKGEFVIFLDDDNIPTPDMVERYVRAALKTGAHIVTCQVNTFVGEGPGPGAAPPGGWLPSRDWIPLGGPIAAGMLKNCFGDAGFMLRRADFLAWGGMSTDRCGFEDWEFLLRAALDGRLIVCVPDVLFHYRVSPQSMLRRMSSSDAYRSHARVARVWESEANGPALREALRLALEIRVAPRYAHGAGSDPGQWNGPEAFREAAQAARDGGMGGTARVLLEQALRLRPNDASLQLELLALPQAPLFDLAPLPALMKPAHAAQGRRAASALRAAGRTIDATLLDSAIDALSP
jgi:glycosyltransferase involved in cell wall biosynthesis